MLQNYEKLDAAVLDELRLNRAVLAATAERARRGIKQPDCSLIARSGKTSIWHTPKTDSTNFPSERPPFTGFSELYRGFPTDKLELVLESGLDVPAQAPFCATRYADKSWEYPVGRTIPTMAVLDEQQTERSFAQRPADAEDTWTPDKTVYPHMYVENGIEVHTRFEWYHKPASFFDERMYGTWVPGNARDALLAVIIGGPESVVFDLLQPLQLPPPYAVQFI